MDVLDEKTNGVPPMEIDEVVSVHDREPPTCWVLADSIMTLFPLTQMRHLQPSICQTWGTMLKTLKSFHGHCVGGRSSRKS
jgi:hypothetical protein